MSDPVTPGTRTVTCAQCNTQLTIGEPGPNDWDAVTEPDLSLPSRQQKVTSWRVVFKCWSCGSRTAIIREVEPQ
jgi:hypothetical protein